MKKGILYKTAALVASIFLPQLALSQTFATASYFDGRLLTERDLQSVQVSVPGLYNPTSGLRTNREDFEKPIKISQKLERDSVLYQYYTSGTPLERIIITVPIASSNTSRAASHLRFELANVIIPSYSVSNNAGEDSDPIENITLSYSKISWSYD